jgi:ATP-dependent DNA helicase RecG
MKENHQLEWKESWRDDRLRLWNPAVLPDRWTVNRSGEIETWGRGIDRILNACKDAGTPKPTLHFDGAGLTLEFRFAADYLKAMAGTAQVGEQVTGQVGRLLSVLAVGSLGRIEAQSALQLKSQANFRDRYLTPALAAALIERTIPDKPNSRLQKYRLTAKGRALIGNYEAEKK